MQVTCNFKLQVVDSATLKAVTAAPTLAGTWSTTKSTSGAWPYNASYSGTSAGLVTAKSSKTLAQSGGGVCTLTVTKITLSGYSGMDPGATFKVFTHKW